MAEENNIQQIENTNDSFMNAYGWEDGYMSLSPYRMCYCQDDGDIYDEERIYVDITKPPLANNVSIKKAELILESTSEEMYEFNFVIGLYNVTGNIMSGSCNPTYDAEVLDYIKVDTISQGTKLRFNVTSIMDMFNNGDISSKKLMFKFMEESGYIINFKKPYLAITYNTKYGFDETKSFHSHEIGRFGQGNIDLVTGNLILESEDFAYSGLRMPVTIKHLYHSALGGYVYTANNDIMLHTSDFSSMRIGNGFKLNVMQSITYLSGSDIYVFVDQNGNETYFNKTEQTEIYDGATYYLYECENDSTAIYRPHTRSFTLDGNEYKFDDAGRLIRITDCEHSQNHIDIIYSMGKLTSVTDGAGRAFEFVYSGAYLTEIIAPDQSKVTYTYDGALLKTITYPDGTKAELTYVLSKLSEVVIYDQQNNELYKVVYEFTNGALTKITEYGVKDGSFIEGVSTAYSYYAASNKTLASITEPSEFLGIDTPDIVCHAVYTFDDDGVMIGEYTYGTDFDKIASSGGSGINPYNAENGFESNVDNLLVNHTFANGTNGWNIKQSGDGIINIDVCDRASYGHSSLGIDGSAALTEQEGVYQQTDILSAGEYTFSAYLATLTAEDCDEPMQAMLRVTDTDGNILAQSEILYGTVSEFSRLTVPFTLSTAKAIQVQALVTNMGHIYLNAPQLEKNSFANRYNYMENGNFEQGLNNWENVNGAYVSNEHSFNMTKSLCITGSLTDKCSAKQTVNVNDKASVLETFTLLGWAKGNGLPKENKPEDMCPQFNISATINYESGETQTVTAEFSSCTKEWQPASVQFHKDRAESIVSVEVSCNYDYNTGVAYFDNISLFRDSVQYDVSDADCASTEIPDDDTVSSQEDITPAEFSELMDSFGNALTETTFTDGELGTMYRSFDYNQNNGTMENAGNDLISETDTRGNVTRYIVDPNTSRNQAVIDRCGNKTEYEYDIAGRTSKITSKTASDTELSNVSYTYDAFDNLTEITRGDGMKYSLKYNEFHKLQSIGIDGKTDGDLVTYTYKKCNGRIKTVSYANGNGVEYVYNGNGQVVAERMWIGNASGNITKKYAYDSNGNMVRCVDIENKKEYNYIYENGVLVRSTECNITLDTLNNVTSKTIVSSIDYVYDNQDRIIKKTVTAGDSKTEYFTQYPENSDPVVTVNIDGVEGVDLRCQSKTDSFGRKEFDELQTGKAFVSRKYSYLDGEYSQEHKENGKLKSIPTTNLVSCIELSDGRTLEYEYDREERITKVTDSLDGVTEYTYDALGQLLTERHKAVDAEEFTDVNVMTYDNYGNILTKNGKQYTYDSVWKDKLMSYDGKFMCYDQQGNMQGYGDNSYYWSKRGQLDGMDIISSPEFSLKTFVFTYNANGVRIRKYVNSVRHDYVVDGTKILKETWGNHTLIPLYDNQDNVCGALYDGYAFYFHKNLQGDVIAVVDQNNDVVARYSYDAWGKVTKTVYPHCFDFGEVNPFLYRGYYYDWESGLYYLNSRYYDPEMGRFISADEPGFATIATDIVGHNLFAYCLNDPCNLEDPMGYIALVDDAAVLAFIGLCALTMALVSWMSSSYFRQSWAAFCASARNGLTWIGTTIANGATSAWNWTRQQIKSATSAITAFLTIAKADSKIRTKIRQNSKQRYYAASILKLNGYEYVSIYSAINYTTAKARVAVGLCVFTITKTEARTLASKFPPVIGPEKGKKTIGQYWHYHVKNRKSKAHIFFLF